MGLFHWRNALRNKSTMQQSADLLISAWHIVTGNAARDILKHSAVAVGRGRILAIGPLETLRQCYPGTREIGGERFVLTAGLVSTHVHTTGETMIKGYIPDTLDFETHVFNWLTPLLVARKPIDDRLSARLTAVEMLRTGTTTFLDAGMAHYLDETVEALVEVGIRGRIGQWVWDVPQDIECYRWTTDQAIARLQQQMEAHRGHDDGRIAAWPILVGHATASDTLWKAAATLAGEYRTGMAFHMSPVDIDTRDFQAAFGRRPVTHLAELGVMDRQPVMTHMVHVSDEEMDILESSGAHIAHCPTSAFRCAYGTSQIGRFPEMAARGINVTLGTDGNNASNHLDLMRVGHLMAGLFKDARQDPTVFPADQIFDMMTMGGARALRLDREIGSIEVGKRADLLLHDTDRPEWRPLLNVMNQLIWSADGRGVHTVLVDGKIVVENGRCTTVDEDRLWREAQAAGEDLIGRVTLPR